VKPNDVPRQHPNAAWREVDGAVVIISPEDSVLHELNETASLVWKEADGTRTSQEIAQRLAEEFEVEEATALADTCELVSHLAQRKLLICAKAGA
jgi:hypothetical protein